MGAYVLPLETSAQYLNQISHSSDSQRSIDFHHYPSVQTGTHVNDLGYVFHPSWRFLAGEKSELTLGFESFLRIHASKLGIPGGGVTSINRVSLSYTFGDLFSDRRLAQSIAAGRATSLSVYYMHYAATDRTSQFSAGFMIGHELDRRFLKFQFENDFFAFLGKDQFRTSALSFDIFQDVGKARLGLGVEKLLWTGTTAGLGALDAGEIYPMTGQYGAEYSHGVLAARFHIQNFTLKLGYDADAIRSGIQDKFHTLINDGIIPKGSRSQDRAFIQLSFNVMNWLY